MNIEENQEQLFDSKEPDIDHLKADLERCRSNLGSWIDRASDASQTRRNEWPGKGRYGRKESATAWPWQNAYDLEGNVVEPLIAGDVALLKSSLSKGNIVAAPVESGDIATAKQVTEFMRWRMSTMDELPREAGVAANYLLRRGCDNVKATVLSAAWLKLYKEPSKFEVTMATIMNLIYPKFRQDNQLNPNDLSYIEQVGIDYVNDPLVHQHISVGLFKHFHASGLWAIENAEQLKIPTLVIHGADDHIIDAHGSRKFSEAAGELATLRIYENTKHELHNDNKAQEVLADVSGWLKNI